MDAAVDIGGNPVSTRFSVSIENEQANTRRDSQTCLAKPNSQAQTGSRKCFPVQLTMNRIGNFTPACYRGTLGLLRARFGDLFSSSAMVRWVCNSRDSVLCARVLFLQNGLSKI